VLGFAFGILNLAPGLCKVLVSSVLGANLIFTSINLFAGEPDGYFGGMILQSFCSLVLAIGGHFVQMKLGLHEHGDDLFKKS
jgi:hypothetical protein